VAAYLREANEAPRKTIPSSARSSGMIRVLITAAKDSGNAVHQVTRQKIGHTWFASVGTRLKATPPMTSNPVIPAAP
jgi:hypothetical protein